MPLQTKKNDAYASSVNVFVKKNGVYAVEQALFVKVDEQYLSTLSSAMQFNKATNSQYIGAL